MLVHLYSQVIVIMEIIIRKCGSAVVESVTPEKYKSFLKTVFEVILSFPVLSSFLNIVFFNFRKGLDHPIG